MKKLLILIVVILLGCGAWYLYRSHTAATAAPTTPPVKLQPTVAHPDPSNATFQFEDGPVTLVKGVGTTDVTPDGSITQETDLTDTVAYGDINQDDKNDTVALLMVQSGGSGTFFYLVAYVSGVVQYKGSNAVFIGDRVSPKSISINSNGIISVTYLDRKDGEPLSVDPTVSVTKNFSYTNDTLKAY